MTIIKLIEPPKNTIELFQLSTNLRLFNNLDQENPTTIVKIREHELSQKQLDKISSQGFVLLEPKRPFDFLLQNLPNCKHYEVLVSSQSSQKVSLHNKLYEERQREAKLHGKLFDYLNKLPDYKNRLFGHTSWITKQKLEDFDLAQLIVWSGSDTLNENEITSIIKKSN